ncbi:uncharacterized protein PHACADRAFT_248801 [Phanerochaete carnosa HHB-10118-sp]|uniref:Uncharacterized protein n=1 Tax=Phanerochaete carnosa (strain HHB-10118-sp) TaxID=650164 RepID=K5WRM9_PHACS|nr:uncharacterized protein PHACADRAFT_248801 [Phanerochaete carnosa HHB-10118-sp]EKM61894.1 hypothetical protein PHACADRAFT_248801 [Phanerochaete carnosa HHB-10118-sp]
MRTHLSLEGKLWEGHVTGVCWQDDRPLDKLRPVADNTELFCCPVQHLDDVLLQESHVAELFGTPLVLMRRQSQFLTIPRHYVQDEHTGPGPTNPTAVLLTSIKNGFASDTWYAGNGRPWAMAWRKDGKPLTPETFETILEFISIVVQDIASVFVSDGWCPMKEQFTPQAFQLFSRRYFREQREKGRLSFEGPFEPL